MSIPSLVEYISDRERLAQLAIATGAAPQWLWQIANVWRGKRPSPNLANAIEFATKGVVKREDLLPDIFGKPQPEPGEPADKKAAA